MRRITQALFAGLVVVSLSARAAIAAAPKPSQYPTYHVNELFLTPYTVKTTTDLGDYSTPDAGNTYLVVGFHAVNRDDVENEVRRSDFKLILGRQSRDPDNYASVPDSLAHEVIEPSAHLDGRIVFQVARGMHTATLTWAPAPPQEVVSLTYPSYRWRLRF